MVVSVLIWLIFTYIFQLMTMLPRAGASPGQVGHFAIMMDWLTTRLSNVFLTHLPLDKIAAILADHIFNCIFLNENNRILIKISLKFVLKCPISNIPALVQIMAWRRPGDYWVKYLTQGVWRFLDIYVQNICHYTNILFFSARPKLTKLWLPGGLPYVHPTENYPTIPLILTIY